jgi:hypothetical protein
VGRELLRAPGLEALVELVEPAVQRLVGRIPTTTREQVAKIRVLVLDVRVPAGFRAPASAGAEGTPAAAIALTPSPVAPVLPIATPPQRDVLPLGGLGAVIACVQRAVPCAMQSQDRYLSWVDAAAGPSCRERYVTYGLYAPYDDARERCAEAVTASAELAPLRVELQALAQAVEALWPPLTEASSYYQGQDYLDDDCARGQALHPRLLQGFAALQRAVEALVPRLDSAAALALDAPAGTDSARRRSLIDFCAALVAFARQAPLWRDAGWAPTPGLHAAHELVQERWRAVQGLPVPQDTLQSTLWKSIVMSSEPPITEFKRRMRSYRDVEKWQQQRARSEVRRFDPEEIRGPVYELLLDIHRMRLLE